MNKKEYNVALQSHLEETTVVMSGGQRRELRPDNHWLSSHGLYFKSGKT